MQWKFNGNRPVYAQIMEHIRGAILAGEYPAGARIPPVRELAAQAQVNPNTMQRALLELERDGLLIACGTMGRFVTDDTTILESVYREHVAQVVRSAAEMFRAVGLQPEEAAKLLMDLAKEESNG